MNNLAFTEQVVDTIRFEKVKVKRTCIAPFVKLQLKALRYGSHRVAPANYTIPASTLQTFARWCHLNGIHLYAVKVALLLIYRPLSSELA